MTQSISLAEQLRSKQSKLAREQTLAQAIKSHLDNEKVSFHTPGHKGRFKVPAFGDLETLFGIDVTELPGLDQLGEADSVLQGLQEKIASMFSASESYISVNGASAALCAAIMSCSSGGRKILLPEDVHRSALNALIFSGLEPVFYESEFLSQWQITGACSPENIEKLIAANPDLVAVVVCSPNYAGVISDVASVAEICKRNEIVLIVDEAHGAHFASSESFPLSALSQGADLVVHSLHKTLSAPTQTGLLHVGREGIVEPKHLSSFINILQSSSPSYLLLAGIERALEEELFGERAAQHVLQLSFRVREFVLSSSDFELLDGRLDPLHIMLRHKSLTAQQLNRVLQEQGVFVETILGEGVLLLLGFGTASADIDYLISCLQSVETNASSVVSEERQPYPRYPMTGKKFMSPRKAFFSKSEMVDLQASIGRVAAENYAPCPPGWAALLAGQQIDSSVLNVVSANRKVRVVNSTFEGDSDGSNTPS